MIAALARTSGRIWVDPDRISPTYTTSTSEDDFLLINRGGDSLRWEDCIYKLLEYRRLEDGWDGLDAVAPPPILVDGAIRLVQQLRRQSDFQPPTRIVAGLGGEILFEWQSPGVYAELEVSEPSTGELMIVEDGKPTIHAILKW